MKIRQLLSVAAVVIASTAAIRQSTVTVEAAIGKSVASGMPVDTAATFAADVGTVVCWTRVTGADAGSKITHVWMHNGDSSKVELNIGGSPWRTYSRKTIGSDGAGDWKVEIRDADGKVLATKSFKVG
jgi:hypothetical protein